MKTLEDLVSELNDIHFRDRGCKPFSVKESDETYLHVFFYNESILIFDRKYGYQICFCMGEVSSHYQHLIVEYLANTNPDDWFPEKKYYIAIGQYDEDSKTLYYKNTCSTGFSLVTKFDFNENDLTSREIFTENEIEELKATLSDNMAKIVEMGKVEVK